MPESRAVWPPFAVNARSEERFAVNGRCEGAFPSQRPISANQSLTASVSSKSLLTAAKASKPAPHSGRFRQAGSSLRQKPANPSLAAVDFGQSVDRIDKTQQVDPSLRLTQQTSPHGTRTRQAPPHCVQSQQTLPCRGRPRPIGSSLRETQRDSLSLCSKQADCPGDQSLQAGSE